MQQNHFQILDYAISTLQTKTLKYPCLNAPRLVHWFCHCVSPSAVDVDFKPD